MNLREFGALVLAIAVLALAACTPQTNGDNSSAGEVPSDSQLPAITSVEVWDLGEYERTEAPGLKRLEPTIYAVEMLQYVQMLARSGKLVPGDTDLRYTVVHPGMLVICDDDSGQRIIDGAATSSYNNGILWCPTLGVLTITPVAVESQMQANTSADLHFLRAAYVYMVAFSATMEPPDQRFVLGSPLFRDYVACLHGAVYAEHVVLSGTGGESALQEYYRGHDTQFKAAEVGFNAGECSVL